VNLLVYDIYSSPNTFFQSSGFWFPASSTQKSNGFLWPHWLSEPDNFLTKLKKNMSEADYAYLESGRKKSAEASPRVLRGRYVLCGNPYPLHRLDSALICGWEDLNCWSQLNYSDVDHWRIGPSGWTDLEKRKKALVTCKHPVQLWQKSVVYIYTFQKGDCV